MISGIALRTGVSTALWRAATVRRTTRQEWRNLARTAGTGVVFLALGRGIAASDPVRLVVQVRAATRGVTGILIAALAFTGTAGHARSMVRLAGTLRIAGILSAAVGRSVAAIGTVVDVHVAGTIPVASIVQEALTRGGAAVGVHSRKRISRATGLSTGADLIHVAITDGWTADERARSSLELAVGIAAVGGHVWTVVTVLTRVDNAVTADRHNQVDRVVLGLAEVAA